jgi:hypothetical protein
MVYYTAIFYYGRRKLGLVMINPIVRVAEFGLAVLGCQILPTLFPLIASGGNCSGNVLLRLGLFVILEFSIVSLDGIFIVVLPV